MSNEVTIGKQDGEVKKESRPVALQDIPPRLRKQLIVAEQKETAPLIAAAASSPVDEQLEWFRAYRYGLYDVAKDEEEAFAHLDQYIAMREKSGEERYNVYRELLRSFAQGNERIQADAAGIEHISKMLYVSTDLQDNESISSAITLLNSENVHNEFVEYLQRIRQETAVVKSLFRCEPTEKPPYWKYMIGFYGIVRTFKKDRKLFLQFVGIEALFIIALVINPSKFACGMLFGLPFLLQSISLIKEDWKWIAWRNSCILWGVLHGFRIVHPQLETLNNKFIGWEDVAVQPVGFIRWYSIVSLVFATLICFWVALFS